MWQKPDDGTYRTLQSKVVKHMQYQGHASEKVLATLVEAYENALATNNVVLSRPERALLFKTAVTQLLNELIENQK
jgi:hypothetical protein